MAGLSLRDKLAGKGAGFERRSVIGGVVDMQKGATSDDAARLPRSYSRPSVGWRGSVGNRKCLRAVEEKVMSREDVRLEEVVRPLPTIADAFEELVCSLSPGGADRHLRLDEFCDACSHVSVLFNCLGLAFKFAEMEYVHKVHELFEASKSYDTLVGILDYDVANATVKSKGSHTRNLRRVRQGLDLIRALFQQFLSSDSLPLSEAASIAYAEVCAPYHSWAIRKAVFFGMYALPSREQLLIKINETDHSVETEMKRYIAASDTIIQYIDRLYTEKNITLDW